MMALNFAFAVFLRLLCETCFELSSTAVPDYLMVHGLKCTFDPKQVSASYSCMTM